jgi:hypothetical protein
MSASVQVVMGLLLAPPWRWRRADLKCRPAALTVVAYVAAGLAKNRLPGTGGAAAAFVPLVATRPALRGAVGMLVLRELACRRLLNGIGVRSVEPPSGP